MQWLLRRAHAIAPTSGPIIEPFLGSGTTLEAALLEGIDTYGIERDPKYAEIAKARIKAAKKGGVNG